jgi:hypothetical protein
MLIERAQRPQSCLGPSPSVGAYAANIGVGGETANPSAEGIVRIRQLVVKVLKRTIRNGYGGDFRGR